MYHTVTKRPDSSTPVRVSMPPDKTRAASKPLTRQEEGEKTVFVKLVR